ncbi:unnamed protein product [Cylicostephanus goldi]|uniref:Uncharacterized protein n=1 Tax=Cylicostephanus goldi TaxID=71465 RepID=A0A3P7N8C8_CYLGO|nr:unnamed protein product [Cylicostephanus goldi]
MLVESGYMHIQATKPDTVENKNYNMFGKFFLMMVESGYMHIQSTKPDTVGTALNDSPLGLAAYILEKFSTWTNNKYRELPDGGLTKKFTRDELLTIVMIYWVNGNIVSSQRFYREHFLDEKNNALQKWVFRWGKIKYKFYNS